jgi:hypothetical protein
MLGFELGRPNIVGVLDHHSFGGLIMRPPDAVVGSDARRLNYDAIGARMKDAMKKPYAYMPTDHLYPTTGDSSACMEVNHRYGMVIEMGSSFRPSGGAIRKTVPEVVKADLAFLDAMIEVSRKP